MKIHKMYHNKIQTACGIFLLDLMVMGGQASKRFKFVTCKKCLRKEPRP